MKALRATLLFGALSFMACHHHRHKAEAVESEATTAPAPAAGDTCDQACPAGEVCKLVNVQCVRAPCPPVPQCVPAGTK